jgi:hypothetical protein
MNKLNRYLLVLLVVQVALLFLVWLMPSGTPADRPRKVLEGKVDPQAVTRIVVVGNDGKKVEVAKSVGSGAKGGDGWVLASAGDYPVQASKVNELCGKLPGLLAGSPVTTKSSHYAALEVADGAFQRDVTLEQTGKPTLRFYLGTGGGIKDVHLRLAGEDAVYLVKDLSAYDWGTMASDWVSTEYLKVDRESIVGLKVENKEGTVELARGGDGKWTLTDLTDGTTLKDGEVDSLVSAVSAVTLQEPVGKKVEPAQGLDRPTATVTLLVKRPRLTDKKDDKSDGVPTAERLFIGAKSGDSYFAKSERSPFVVKLSTWTAETFLKKKKSDFEEQPKKEGEKKDEAAPGMPPGMPPGGMPGMPPMGGDEP